MKRNEQQGIAHLAAIVAAVVIAAIIGAAVYVKDKGSSTDKNSASGATATSTPSSTTKNTTKSADADKTAAQAAAKDHFALVYQKKTTEAYESTCQGFKDKTSETTFTNQLERGNFYSVDFSAIEYTSVEVKNNQAKLSGPIGPLVPNTNMEVSLLKENNHWCVFGYQTN